MLRMVLVPAWAASVLATLVVATTSRAGDVEGLAWLEGRWAGEKDGVRSEERWTGLLGGALLGMHADVKAGRLVSWEFLRIDRGTGGAFYYASPRSAPPTPFKLVEVGEKRAVFENKEHDFPQRILYWLDGAGALHARIEGPQAGKTVSEEWVWTKTP
jgi:hypothetical protein